jgi:hypothetical protein
MSAYHKLYGTLTTTKTSRRILSSHPHRVLSSHLCKRLRAPRAQISVEFIIVAGTAILLLVALLSIAAYQLTSATTDETLAAMEDLTRSIELELLTARSVGDGYTRSFTLPSRIQGRQYTLALASDGDAVSVLTLTTAGRNQSIAVPRCTGTLSPGLNTFATVNGTIRCN